MSNTDKTPSVRDLIPLEVRVASRAVFDCPNRETFEARWRNLHEVWQRYEPVLDKPKLNVIFNFPENKDY